ncbi:DUF3817 domain-containing protein [Flammeovirga yaeyamensis]|uniref:DUF3817 domain-containing protein n=1 Tax=Flammeovirga yaeyamensis TaxID=367791 RepID=A0AAX1N3T8_9BACT|nr:MULTISPECIES: DUF3817 domain-containing protein [Flammeovirga]ANQ50449.1 DUF3817 domain-containing protein [Flammeovirga sp. MY04]MBB3699593.1 integral membrane protein [Flammeovirga yaeyamensis]NMF36834.1 DUF3817 domain-containing protein [Flammeovirga yaeyamensis]QWG02127.1 DUF3817 domain-containing protein [Flammeovirga yaeyamensis]
MTSIKGLRIVGFLEGISFLLLVFICMPLKYMADMGMPNKIVGMAHGVLFIAYIYLVLQVHFDKKWGFKNSIWSFIASLLPFGTFVADKKIFVKYID